MHAEVLFVNGSLFSAGMPSSRPGILAVRSGRIMAVGRSHEVDDLRGPDTEIVDLAGGLLLPGFQDAHVHPVMAGVNLLQCDLHDETSAEGALARIASYAESRADAPWIVGAGWSMEHFPGGIPTRQQLDSVVADRPAYLTNRDGHGVWVNTRALELAGITAETPDPADGRIERAPDGSPTGMLHEGANRLVEHLLPVVGPDEQLAGLRAAQAHLFSLGITAWQDAAVGAMFGQADILPVYLRAVGSGDLVARVVGALWWDRERGAEQIPDLVARRDAGSVGRFQCSTVKMMLDGVAENFTAAMLEPYLDGCGCQTGNSGLSFVDPAALKEYVTELDAQGFQVHFHALGDRAVRDALDALEAALAANGPTDHRHHLAHLQVVHPEDIPRFAQVGATANIQALWARARAADGRADDPVPRRSPRVMAVPVRRHRQGRGRAGRGQRLVGEQRRPVGGHPRRGQPGRPEAPPGTEPLYPDSALSLATALTAYTSGSARVNHLDDVTGQLTAGRLADLAILDRDPFQGPADQIAASTVTSTWVEGQQVHTRP